LLKELGEQLGATVTTRDAWVKLEGDESAVAAGVDVFGDLEKARRSGGVITPHSFRYAVGAAAGAMGGAGEGKAETVSDLVKSQLLGSGSKPAVVPRTKNQLDYIESLDSHDVAFGIGPAGTGKTYLAMAYALDLLKK